MRHEKKIFKLLGTPTSTQWPGFEELPHVKAFQFAQHEPGPVKAMFMGKLTESGMDLLTRLLAHDPERRLRADQALHHPYFDESPRPKHPSMFPTWPSKFEGNDSSTASANAHTPIKPSTPVAPAGHVTRNEDEELRRLYEQRNADIRGFQLKL